MKFVTAAEMREIDRRAIEEYGIPSLVLMENAGRASAEEAVRLCERLKGAKQSQGLLRRVAPRNDKRIAIFSGKGNNGGDGFVIARHLSNHGFKPTVFCFEIPSRMKPDALLNFKILERMKINLIDCSQNPDWQQVAKITNASKVVVDALFGTGLSKPISEPFHTAIQIVNESKRPVVAIDIPSGMDSDSGEILGICVRAKRTVTLGLPKKAFLSKSARRYTGKVVIADISIPRALLAENR